MGIDAVPSTSSESALARKSLDVPAHPPTASCGHNHDPVCGMRARGSPRAAEATITLGSWSAVQPKGANCLNRRVDPAVAAGASRGTISRKYREKPDLWDIWRRMRSPERKARALPGDLRKEAKLLREV